MTTLPPDKEDFRNTVIQAVLNHVRTAIPADMKCEPTLDTVLYDLGLDSLNVMAVINHIEEVFGMRFREEQLYGMETCRDLVDCVVAHATQSIPECPPVAETTVVKVAEPETPVGSEVAVECYDVAKFPECVAFEQRLALAAASGFANPFFHVNQRVANPTAVIDGHEVIGYTSFDYLGLASHPQVAASAKEAIDRFGTSASASRLVGGDNTIIEQLDTELAQFLGTEAAIVFPSGYGTNASLFGHLFGADDLILYDELAHNSIAQGVALSKAGHRSFPHNDFASLDRLLVDLRGQYRRVVVALEGVYSMDGDYPDLPRFLEIKKRHRALLYVDEAHSVGTMGARGRGICEHFGVDPAEGDLWMGTISKALASGGGYLAGRKELMQYLKYTTPSFVFSTGCSPANAAASLAALRLLQQEPQRVARLRDRSALFLKLAKAQGFDTGNSGNTPVIPVILGDSMRCVKVSHQLLCRGVNASPILYPAVRNSAARIRFFMTSEHTEEQITRTVQALVDCLAEEGKK